MMFSHEDIIPRLLIVRVRPFWLWSRSSDYFGFEIPTALPGIDPKVLNPYEAWDDKEAFDATSRQLAGMFGENFKKYVTPEMDFSEHGPTCL